MRLVLIAAILMSSSAAFAEDCPPGVRSCRVVIMSDEEINTLTGPGAVFDAAVFANRMQITPIVEAWKRKIETSPAGTVKAPPEPKAEPKPGQK